MGYSDNPRKVFGRVEIIYADEELSRDITTEESGNSEISHPKEVYHLPSEPTVKACTMDGNATMDGTFQMMDDSVLCGWWSGKLSDADGVFADKPFIELKFTNRPIIYWKVIGDSKLNQYPVDFAVEYKRNGKVVRTETIEGNTEMERVLEPRIDDITSVRLTIAKWSVPNACAKILRFYERLYEIYEGNALQSFEVGEELCSTEGNYNINSDTMTVSVYNEGRKFDKGYLRTLMLLDRKLLPSIGTENNGKVEYTPLGTFYSDEWQIDQDSQWVKCSATDRLMRLQTKMYVGFPLTDNASLYEIAEDILQKTGHTADEYYISPTLKDIVVDLAFLPKIEAWDALQEIANAGLCKVFVDRQNRICITAESDAAAVSAIPIYPGNMFSLVSNATLTDFANCIHVEYSTVTVTEDIIDVTDTEVRLDAGQSVDLAIDYTSEIAYPSAVTNNAAVRLTNFDSGTNSCSCTVTNTSATAQTAVITVSGNAIEIKSNKITKRDEVSIELYGTVEYSHTASELVQSLEQAEYIATVLLNKMRAGQGSITTVWRGNPELEIGLEYDCTDRFGETSRLLCEYSKFSYDGGLKQETRGRKI